ncbi:MAG: homoserine dehydrogenase [Pseudomonadota bacterium]
MKTIQVGLLGIGTVGGGTFNVLARNQAEIQRRAGRPIQITMVADLDTERARRAVGDGVTVVADARAVIANPEIDIVVELIGGYGIARSLVLEAIAAGKHVVTANKALLAVHGTEIFKAARDKGVVVAFEAAVAGGIPIIKALREGLTANRIEWIAGIINGTTNYILSEMKDKGASFAAALADAQAKGYAEADPAFDVEGVDAAHKLTLLASNAFGVPIQFDKVHVEGITQLDAVDVAFAERLGYCVKLLGIAKRNPQGLELRVHPTLVAAKHLLAQVNGSMNAVMVKSDAAGVTMYYGAGAGSEQTASAVIADLVDLARSSSVLHRHRVPSLAFQHSAIVALPVAAIEDVETAFYLRLDVTKLSRTLPQVLAQLAEAGVRVRQLDVLEHPLDPELSAVVVQTEPTQRRLLQRATAVLEQLPTVMGFAKTIRMERLD